MNSVITLKNVNLSYQTKYQKLDILKGLNMEIANNEYVVIMGKSGTGKSTILNLISGFLSANNGNVIVNGKDISNLTEKEICEFRNKTIGYVFQSFNLIYQFTVLENIMVPMLIAGTKKAEAKERARGLLKKVMLENRGNHFPNQLSGGEQQRVGIARALANNPDIVIGDEPTGNLDEATSKCILDIFDEIHKDGKTIVLVTHDEDVAKRATRVVKMSDIKGVIEC